MPTRSSSSRLGSLSTFQLVGVRHVELMTGTAIPGTSRVIGAHHWDEHGSPWPLEYVVFDYPSSSVVDSFIIDPDPEGNGVWLKDLELSGDGERLFGIGYGPGGYAVIGYDLRTHRTLFRHLYDARGGGGNCRLTPDERELWYTHGANCFDIPWRSSIEIIDARTGEFLDTVAVNLGWPEISPWDIRFDPSGAKAYVNCGTSCTLGPLLVIDAKTREITKVLFSDSTHSPSAIDLAPVP